MDEITLDGKTYVSSKRAAQITGYAKDYVGQLCREGRVTARLVGRNWYVLEQSIREHRFGAENNVSTSAPSEVEAAPEITTTSLHAEVPTVNALESGWKSPNYISEPAPALLPTLNSEENTASKEQIGDSFAIKEMQSAWHDWFVRTNELKTSEETLLESPEIPIRNRISDSGEFVQMPQSESLKSISESIVRIHEPNVELSSTPITLEKVSEIIEKQQLYEDSFGQEEPVVLHRSVLTPPQVSQSFADDIRNNRNSDAHRRSTNSQAGRLEEGRVIRERRIQIKKKPSIILQALFLSIAGIALVITLIGTGALDASLAHSNISYAPFQYLEGQTIILKASK